MVTLRLSEYNSLCRLIQCGLMAMEDAPGIPKGIWLAARGFAKREVTEGSVRLLLWLDHPKTREKVIWVLLPDGRFTKRRPVKEPALLREVEKIKQMVEEKRERR